MITLDQIHFDEVVAHAREESPRECCGLIGGSADGAARSIYRARNVAPQPLVTYEAAPEDLFLAQRAMRERGEQLIAIYHSHPRSTNPQPSQTDVRLAYYPAAVYFIVGMGSEEPCMRAFRIREQHGWESIAYEVTDDRDQ